MRLAEGAQRFQLGLNSQNPTAADSWIKPAPARPAAARFSYTTPNRARRNTGKNTSDDLTQDALESGNMRSLGSHYSSAGQVVGLFGILGVWCGVHGSLQSKAIRRGSVELTVDVDWPRPHAGRHNL